VKIQVLFDMTLYIWVSAFIFSANLGIYLKAIWSFKLSGSSNPASHWHIPEDFNFSHIAV